MITIGGTMREQRNSSVGAIAPAFLFAHSGEDQMHILPSTVSFLTDSRKKIVRFGLSESWYICPRYSLLSRTQKEALKVTFEEVFVSIEWLLILGFVIFLSYGISQWLGLMYTGVLRSPLVVWLSDPSLAQLIELLG